MAKGSGADGMSTEASDSNDSSPNENGVALQFNKDDLNSWTWRDSDSNVEKLLNRMCMDAVSLFIDECAKDAEFLITIRDGTPSFTLWALDADLVIAMPLERVQLFLDNEEDDSKAIAALETIIATIRSEAAERKAARKRAGLVDD